MIHLKKRHKCTRLLVQAVYLLGSSKSMVEAGNIGHDSSLIGFRGVDDVYRREREEDNRKFGWQENVPLEKREHNTGREHGVEIQKDLTHLGHFRI